ncbi:unnamed protein product [Trichobilharzia regenti]|nr:unnamed protein product [Trichobilharzia regenti]
MNIVYPMPKFSQTIKSELGSQPLIRRNSEPRLFFNTNMSRSTVQSALFTPQLQNNLTDSTYTPKSLFRPQTSRLGIEHEYQSLAPVIDNRTAVMMRTATTANAHSSRCLTPFFDYRSHHTPQHMIEQVGGMRNGYRNWIPIHLQQSSTPMDISHQSLVHLETTLNNNNNNDNSNNREAVQLPKSPTIIYAASPDPQKHPIHFRGDSLPVYPMNQLQNTPNLKSFHQVPVEAIPGKHLPPPHHSHHHHPLSTYQDISLLQATLRRHNRRSIIMTTHSNPMMTYSHHHHHHHQQQQQQHQPHHSNRLAASTANHRNQFKTLHTPKHHTGIGTFTPTPSTAATMTPRLMYSNNLKPYNSNKTRYHISTPLKDELECEQLLLLKSRNNENNENQKLLHQPDDVINSNYVDSNDGNNNNNDRDDVDNDIEHLTERPNNLNFAKMSHDQQSTNQQTEANQLNYHEDQDGDENADGDDGDDGDDNDNEECDHHQGVSGLLKSVSSTNSLPMLIDMNNSSGEDSNNLNKFTQPPQKWYPTSPTSTMHLLSNQSNPCKYTYKTFREASFV